MLNDLFNNIRIKIRERLNPYLGNYRRNKGGVTFPFTIISNNCWAGHVYRYYNLPYTSPTIGLYFFSDDYLKFIFNLKHYLEIKLTFIHYTESKYKDNIIKNHHEHIPIGKLDDIEIMFLHYNSKEEALQKWERRVARVDWNNINFKMSEQNLCSVSHLLKFDTLPTFNKFVFVTKDYGLDSQIIFHDCDGMEYIPNDTTNFKKFINISNWLKGKPFKLKQ